MTQGNTSWEYLAWDLKNHLIEIGKSKINLNNFADALIDLNKAIDVYPKDPLIFIKNGKEKENNRDISGAIDDYDKAIKFSLIYIYIGYINQGLEILKELLKIMKEQKISKRNIIMFSF